MAKKMTPAAKPEQPKKAAGKRTRWLDPKSQAPLLRQHAEKMQSFMTAAADGVIDDKELQAQEQALVALMQEVEPLLDDALHEKVTRLLCEVTVYDMMQMMRTIQETRPASRFRG